MMGGCCDALLGSCEDSCFQQLTATGFFVQGKMPVCIAVGDNCLFCDVLVEAGTVCGWLVCSVCLSSDELDPESNELHSCTGSAQCLS